MKLNKIFAIALAALTLTACSDDDDWNTASDVTVSMQSTTIGVNEDFVAGDYSYIPVVVNGKANGPIKVTIETAPATENPAVVEDDYVVTSYTITIPADQQVGYFEFHTVANTDVSPDKVFTATITKVEGAKIGDQATCDVTILDNDRYIYEAYEKIAGSWTLTGHEKYDDSTTTFGLTCVTVDEGEEGYLEDFYMVGYEGIGSCVLQGQLGFDASTMQATVYFPYGQTLIEGITLNFSSGAKVCDFILGSLTYSSGYSYSLSGGVSGTVSSDYSTITFPDDAIFCSLITSGGSVVSWYSWLDQVSITRN